MTVRRVLVVEDETSIAQVIRLYLEREGHQVTVVGDGDAALDAVRRTTPDLIVLDIALPGIDGIEVCRRLRSADDWTPVIFVTARDEEVDRVVGLELGADDYLTKPFSPRELVARAKAVLRRHDRSARTAGEEVLEAGGIRLDPVRRRAWAAGEQVDLTATEFDLLTCLMRRPGRVYRRRELLELVWDYPGAGDTTRTVDVHVAQVRAKLGAHSPIRTVRGVGYACEDGR
jgi:DNA-binding response OmpR family regulator